MQGWMKWVIALLVGFGVIVVGFRYAVLLLETFFVMNCLVLIIVVLLQSGKAADLAGAFGGAGSQTAFGPRGAASVLSQATTWCAVMFMVCALALVLHTDKGVGQGGSVLEKFSKPAPVKPAAPKTLTPQPGTPQPGAPQSTPSNTPAPTTPPQSTQPPAKQPPVNSQPAPESPKKP